MTRPLRDRLHRSIPSNFHDPFGLAVRLIKSRDRAAWFSMQCAALGLVAMPFEGFLRRAEQRRLDAATDTELPQLFVCGPPRSGTTVFAAMLLRHLPATYFPNLTSVFPNTPISACQAFRSTVAKRRVTSHSFYGRSTHLSGPNDALYLWDRWLGADRSRIPDVLDDSTREAMSRFFAAWQTQFPAPLINKCNNLNAGAHLVKEALPRATFFCLEREPLYHAQSLYRARLDIHGDDGVPYGLHDPKASPEADALNDVCDQVRFHRRLAQQQQERLGNDVFIRVPYEDFCADPGSWVERAGRGIDLEPHDLDQLQPLRVSRRQSVDAETFEGLRRRLGPDDGP